MDDLPETQLHFPPTQDEINTITDSEVNVYTITDSDENEKEDEENSSSSPPPPFTLPKTKIEKRKGKKPRKTSTISTSLSKPFIKIPSDEAIQWASVTAHGESNLSKRIEKRAQNVRKARHSADVTAALIEIQNVRKARHSEKVTARLLENNMLRKTATDNSVLDADIQLKNTKKRKPVIAYDEHDESEMLVKRVKKPMQKLSIHRSVSSVQKTVAAPVKVSLPLSKKERKAQEEERLNKVRMITGIVRYVFLFSG
jgi:hypothetical protein